MSNQIKFTEQELAEIRMLQGKFQEKVFQFGQFRLERMNMLKLVKGLEERELKAEEEYSNLQGMEDSLLEKLMKKYGEGQLDLEDGLFIPAVPVTSKEKAAL
jgi:hypothetical protein